MNPIAITRCSVLTPLDYPCSRADPVSWMGTWEALLAGKDVCANPRAL